MVNTRIVSRGYWQAIENVAYEIDLIVGQVDAAPGDDSAKIVSFIARQDAYQLVSEQMRILDDIIDIIGETYHQTNGQMSKDIDIVLDNIERKRRMLK